MWRKCGTGVAKAVGGKPQKIGPSCCPGACWVAAVYVAGKSDFLLAHFGDGRMSAMWSLRSTQPDGTTFDLAISVPYGVDDGLGGVRFKQTAATISIPVGLDTGGAWWTGNAAGQANPVFDPIDGQPFYWWIKAFRPSDTTPPQFCAPPEWGLPLQTKKVSSVWLSKAHVDWGDVFDKATVALAPITVPFDNAPIAWGGVGPIISTHYDVPPGAGFLDALPDQPSALNIRVFNKAVYSTPGAKTTDDLFDLEVKFYNLYTGQPVFTFAAAGDPQAEVDMDTVPTLALVAAAGSATIAYTSIDQVVIGGVPQWGWYKFRNCRFLCQKGSRQIDVWPDFEPFHLGPIGFVDFWKIRSGTVLVSPGVAAWFTIDDYSIAGVPTFDAPVIASAAIRGFGTDPIKVRITDEVGQLRNVLYNLISSATNVVSFALAETGSNFYAGSPSLQGTTSVAAVGGVADFDDLAILGLGRNYSITASCAPFPADPANFRHYILLSVATDLKIVVSPAIHAGVPTSIVVTLVDAVGNPLVPSGADAVSLSGAGSFTGFGTVTPMAGVATFSGTFPAAGTYVIKTATSLVNYDGPSDVPGNTIPARQTTVTVLP